VEEALLVGAERDALCSTSHEDGGAVVPEMKADDERKGHARQAEQRVKRFGFAPVECRELAAEGIGHDVYDGTSVDPDACVTALLTETPKRKKEEGMRPAHPLWQVGCQLSFAEADLQAAGDADGRSG
jgi:hypothetical protein